MTAPAAPIGRRPVVLGGLAALLAAPGCDGCHRDPDAATPPAPLPAGWSELTFPRGPDSPYGERALVRAPEGADRPILVALHGRGESISAELGSRAWLQSYGIDRVYARLLAPPLRAEDLLGIATASRLAAINASLAGAPFRGVVLACPWAPDPEDPVSPDGFSSIGRFLVEGLLPRVRALAGQGPDRSRTGIDGISMGGRVALFVGLSHPEVFGRVGAMQPAVAAEEAGMFSSLAKAAMARADVKLRLLTSDLDSFREPTLALSRRMRADGVPHELVVVAGSHGYEFNKGPGGAEMLLWHDRLAQGVPPV